MTFSLSITTIYVLLTASIFFLHHYLSCPSLSLLSTFLRNNDNWDTEHTNTLKKQGDYYYPIIGNSNEAIAGSRKTQSLIKWVQLGQDIDGDKKFNEFGHSVSISKNGYTIAIGARYIFDNGYRSGIVRVFQYLDDTTNQWVPLGQDIIGEANVDGSAASVSLSDDGWIVAVGTANDDANGLSSGSVKIFQYLDNINEWSQLGGDIIGETAGDQFGSLLSLSADGHTVAISAKGNDSNGSNSGHVRIFQYYNFTNKWSQLGEDIDGEAAGDQSGSNVSLSADGRIVAIGAYGNDSSGTNSGHVRIFQYDTITNKWIQLGEDIDGEAAENYAGSGVSLSEDGKIVAIGSHGSSGNGRYSGHVRIFQYNTDNQWSQIGQNIIGEAAGDWSGRRISLSKDGHLVAIGAHYNDGNGTWSGHTRIYQYSKRSNIWSQVGQDIDGEASGDVSGSSVSLSQDGMIVAIGASRNVGEGVNSGHVRVYELVGPTPSPTFNPTASPTAKSSFDPTFYPSALPTAFPTASPTAQPASYPTVPPAFDSPAASPTTSQTKSPTALLNKAPTSSPNVSPLASPSQQNQNSSSIVLMTSASVAALHFVLLIFVL